MVSLYLQTDLLNLYCKLPNFIVFYSCSEPCDVFSKIGERLTESGKRRWSTFTGGLSHRVPTNEIQTLPYVPEREDAEVRMVT